MKAPGPERCSCGHLRTAHEHYRRGTDCSLCPDKGCQRFRKAGGRLGRLLWRRRSNS